MVVIQIPIEEPNRDDEALFQLIDIRSQDLQDDEFMAMASKYGRHLAAMAKDMVQSTGEPYGSEVTAQLAASSAFTFGYALAQLRMEGLLLYAPKENPDG